MIFTVLVLASAAPTASPKVTAILDARDAYSACVRSAAVSLGATNKESADTVLRAVRAQCGSENDSLVSAYRLAGFPVSYIVRYITRDQTLAEDQAIADLLAARNQR
jgi:hypothetical protein